MISSAFLDLLLPRDPQFHGQLRKIPDALRSRLTFSIGFLTLETGKTSFVSASVVLLFSFLLEVSLGFSRFGLFDPKL